MRILNGVKWVIALTLVVGSANADIVIDNQLIPSADIQSISILPNSGQINIVTSGYTVTKSGTTPAPTADAVAITSFTASPSTFEKGKSTTVSWATTNADSCAVSDTLGELNGAVATNDSAVLSIVDVGSYNFTLTCQGNSGPVSRVLTLTVKEPAPVTTKTCPAATLSGVTKSWAGFWGVAFPQPGYSNVESSVARSGYMALKFDTADIIDNGLLVTVSTTKTSGVRLGTISECPGDFNVRPECDHVWGIGGGISWATNGKSGACQLKPNTTYYFNVTFTNGSDSSTSSCTSIQCVAKLQHVNR